MADDSSGIITMLVGVIVLVFVALGFTVIADLNWKQWFETNNRGLAAEKDALQRRINRKEIEIQQHHHREALIETHREQGEELQDLKAQLTAAGAEAKLLVQMIEDEKETITFLQKEKDAYRLQYREHARAAAVGKTYPLLSTRLGKKYTGVRILEVNQLGVAISHDHGAARLGYRDMPDDWRQNFMFTAREVAKAKLEDQRRVAQQSRKMEERNRVIRNWQKNQSKMSEIASLRTKIASVSMQLSSSRTEARIARNKVRYQENLRLSRTYARSSYSYRRYNDSTGGYYTSSYRPRYRITSSGSKSVPGSLETWEQRAVRYERMVASYEAKLVNLRARLSSLDPSYDLPERVPAN
ncbi:hypothetical protein HW115_14955 [Verrucomicrobiaceae bacterium N1E253]|uniref:Uncharacterized protein n=1 Tax=Oceaniferula marina TaxID=2748318 RepID=A0A851GM61_9BACT|nr:hypothetical protein [Oceaniferula marina]NWK56921.1 hypothetical protein [Oceaniferula marina]